MRGTAENRPSNYYKYCGDCVLQEQDVDGVLKDMCEQVRSLVKQCENQTTCKLDAFLRAYTMNAIYKQVNKGLIEDDPKVLCNMGPFVAGLRSAIRARSKSRNIQSGIVHRCMNLPAEDVQKYQPGFKFLWPTITSTSRKTLAAFGNVHFIINLCGKGMTYAVDVADVSAYPSEEEVLIYPYSGFEVLSNIMQNGKHYIHLVTCDTYLIEEPEFRKKGLQACQWGTVC